MLDIKNLRFTFQLSPQIGDVLYLLMTQKFVSTEELQAIFSNPRVGMYRVRQAVSPYGIDIHVRNQLGYFLDDETKQTIVNMVNEPMKLPEAPPAPEESHADA